MQTFVRLATLTDQGVRNLDALPRMLAEMKTLMEEHGARLVSAWVVLGEYDAVTIFEAPNDKTAAHISALIGSRGNFRAKTLAVIPMEEFIETIRSD